MTGHLSEASRAAKKARSWTDRRNDAIRRARTAGASLRAIAEATGLSHTAIAKLSRSTETTNEGDHQ
jgi:phage terminase small subunit